MISYIIHYNEQMSNYILHHGVEGQKWGVRRDRRKAASLSKKSEATARGAKNVKDLANEFSAKSKSQQAQAKKLEQRANAKEKAAASKKKAQAVLKDPTIKMSDKKLKAEVKRLQMEESYHRLTNNKNAKNATTMQRGQAMALEIVGNAARTNIQNVANKALGDAINLGAELAKKK